MAIVLALLAALLFALAGAAEQRAASRVLRSPASARCATASRAAAWRELGPARRLRHRARYGVHQAAALARNPLWIAGWAADIAGFGTQAGAVHFGSLSVVQPLLVTTLLLSLPLAALGGRRRPRWPDWAAAATVCAGLALVLSGRRSAATASVHQARLVLMALVLVAVAAVLVLVAQARPGRGQAIPLSVAAGMLFALGAACTKLVTDSVASRGISGTVGYWPAYALMVFSLTGLVLQQLAFSAGSLPATMTAMAITDPLVSYGLGVGGFGEHAPHGLGPVALALAGLGLLGAGIAALSRSPLLQRTAAQPIPAPGPAAVPTLAAATATVPATAIVPATATVPATGTAAAVPVTLPASHGGAQQPLALPGGWAGAGQTAHAWQDAAVGVPAPRPPAHAAASTRRLHPYPRVPRQGPLRGRH